MYNAPIPKSMGTHMKTTLDVSDALFASAKKLAQRNQTTMRALVEEGLRRVINDAPAQARSTFKLADARVHGQAMLVTNPTAWQQLEEEHLAAAIRKSAP